MPIQKSNRGLPITSAGFEQAFDTHITRFGIKGVNLTDAPDTLEDNEYSRMLNMTHRQDFGLTSRFGLTQFCSTGAALNHHSIRRLNDPLTGTYIRVHGVDGSLFSGTTGNLGLIDTGYSGNPLSMVTYRPPLSSQTWMYIGDSARMRKVRSDGLDLPIGLPKPVSACTATLDAENKTEAANFTNDGTQFSNWTPNAGFLYDANGELTNTPSSVPIVTDVTDPVGGTGINFQTTDTFRANGYYAYWNCPHAVDMSLVGGVDASDDDYIHLWLNFSHPDQIEEFRIYFVLGGVFSTTLLPGTPDVSAQNGNAYVKAFSGNDFAAFIAAKDAQVVAAEQARLRALRDQSLRDNATTDDRDSTAIRIAERDTSRTITKQSGSAAGQWSEYGVVGIPIRRGDFQRIGTDTNLDWSDVVGIVTMVKNGPAAAVAVQVSDLYMTGGSGPDTGEPGFSKYDYRAVNYDPRTGAISNPSDIMPEANFIDTLRRSITLTTVAYGDAAVRQRFYRRGGSLPTDWTYLGTNTSDGGTFQDTFTDTEQAASTVLEFNNYQPVPTVDSTGTTLLNQPLASLWGPLDDLIYGCGDKYRPGHVYFCKRGNPDSWPDDYLTEVCSPSEQLQAGCLYGGQSFVYSKERLYVLYPSFGSDDITVSATVTQCKKGMVNRWGLAVGIGGMYFVAEDGIYRTAGGPEEWLSKKIDPLFHGKAVRGMYPIDFNYPAAIRLEIHENELFFMYRDTQANRICWVYNIPYGFWRPYIFEREVSSCYSDEGGEDLIFGALNDGEAYTHTGFSDDGNAIPCSVRTLINNFSRPREEKRLGDQFLDFDSQGVALALQNRVNDEIIENAIQGLTSASGRTRAIFDSFGTTPQRVRNISTEISWESATAAPIIYQLGTAYIIEPEITINRVTQWEDLNHPDESYLTGVTFDCDTGNENREIIVEYDFGGAIGVAATLNVVADGRHKVKFSWPAVQAHKVRIRPNDDCQAWQLFKVDWIAQPEPPRIAKWDIHFENAWDQYYTGLDLYCDTNGADKTIEVYVDGILIKTETVNTNGRKVHHITLPWGRGHVFRFVATDNNEGLLYEYRWFLQEEPSEQANWNQNFTVAGTEADKYLKAIVFQCDTFGQTKNVTVECDGVVVETLAINSNGRKVIQVAFPQHLGRVFRVYPVDGNPGRLYSLWWVFDQEPLALDRWETQEITHGLSGWFFPTLMHVCIKSTAEVMLEVIAYNQDGIATSYTYSIPETDGVKRKLFVGLKPTKGVLYKYILTSADPFWLYREETVVKVREWGTEQTIDAHVFGNDDLDTTRGMAKSELAAARSGGTA